MKRNYTTVTPQPVHRQSLMESLGFPGGRLPAAFTFRGNVELFATWGGWPRPSLGVYDIEVVPTNNPGKRRSAGKHRVFIVLGERRIPVGRAAQARA
jgi:hypothetical protein